MLDNLSDPRKRMSAAEGIIYLICEAGFAVTPLTSTTGRPMGAVREASSGLSSNRCADCYIACGGT
jgi:hypothetical protein